MNRDDQTGENAPRKGTMIRQSRAGNAAFSVMALEKFPPPHFLTDTQRNVWIAALGDHPLDFFRARHIPMMIQYVRAVELMMTASDEVQDDPSDSLAMLRWERMMRITTKLESTLSLSTGRLVDMVVRARSEQRAAFQGKRAKDAGESASNARAGLTYVGH